MFQFELFRINDIKPVAYNPRQISDSAFEKLVQSVQKFGVIKPVVVNSNLTIIGGHQRSKAARVAGITEIPCLVSTDEILPMHERHFNLEHNRVEGDNIATDFRLKTQGPGYSFIRIEKSGIKLKSPDRLKAGIESVLSFGNFYSAVVSQSGEIIEGTIAVYISELLDIPLLVYTISDKQAEEYKEFLKVDYGIYSIENSDAQHYNQNLLQPRRKQHVLDSVLYNKQVLPFLKEHPQSRILDFGAGTGITGVLVRKMGYNISTCEPFAVKKGKGTMDLERTIKEEIALMRNLQRHGLFDVITVDSVFNAVLNKDYDNWLYRSHLKNWSFLILSEGLYYANGGSDGRLPIT